MEDVKELLRAPYPLRISRCVSILVLMEDVKERGNCRAFRNSSIVSILVLMEDVKELISA